MSSSKCFKLADSVCFASWGSFYMYKFDFSSKVQKTLFSFYLLGDLIEFNLILQTYLL